VRGELSAADALRVLELAHREDQRVAVVLVDHALADRDRSGVFDAARRLHPDARRALLMEWGAWAARDVAAATLQAMAMGEISYYVLKPWINRDEFFHRVVAEFVQEWARNEPSNYREVVVLADRRTPRAHAVGTLLERNGIPYAFRERGTRMADLVMAQLPPQAAQAEVAVWMPAIEGRLLLDPTDAEVVEAWGIPTTLRADERNFDVLVVGAGPAGLAAAVYASSEGLSTLAVEREAIGGQAGTSSLIRNYLGFSRGVTGAELAQRGYQQAWVFGAHFVLTRDVVALERAARGFVAEIADVGEIGARAVVLATGVSYRRLGIRGLDRLTGAGVYYGASVSAAHALSGLRAAVVGGGNSAGQAVLHLARYCKTVMLLVRGESLAAGMSSYLIDTIEATGNIEVRTAVEVYDGGGDGRLEWAGVRDRRTGVEERLEVDGMFVMIGAQPRTDWLPEDVARDQFGFVLTGADLDSAGWPLERRPFPNETSVPGLFAVGDVRSGSVKRVASAVGEGSVVISQLHQHLAVTGG
jgi:thioredoxin reductase (NADPH)